MLAAAGRQGLPEALQGAGVPLVVAVGEVEPGNVHAGVDEGAERLDAPARGAEGADDLDLPARLIALGEDLVLAGVTVWVWVWGVVRGRQATSRQHRLEMCLEGGEDLVLIGLGGVAAGDSDGQRG